jgi:hypothetical protein
MGEDSSTRGEEMDFLIKDFVWKPIKKKTTRRNLT